MNNKFILILLICAAQVIVHSQIHQEQSSLLSRVKLGFGVVTNLSDEKVFFIKHFFFNFSYRHSDFDKFSSSAKLKGAFELGLNGLILADKDMGVYAFYPLPYLKGGPELRLSRNSFISASAGLALIYFIGEIEIVPFAGLNGFYLFRLSDKTCIEFETGFHIPAVSIQKTNYLIYISAGISFY